MQPGNIYYKIRSMTRVYIANAKPEERSALRLMLYDLNMVVVGEASDWPTTVAQAPETNFDVLLVDWDLLPANPTANLSALRQACSHAINIILTSYLDARQQAALSAGADAFLSKGEIPNRLAERLVIAAHILDN